MSRILKALTLLILCLVSPTAPAQVVLVAHQTSAIGNLTRNEARLLFTMRLKNWPDGTLVRVHVLPDNHDVHRRFANEILGLYPYQLRRGWDRQLFSGTGQAPVTVANEREMLDRLVTTPGAIGYLSRAVEHPALRVIEVE